MMKTGKPAPTKTPAAKLAPQQIRKPIPAATPGRNTPRRPSK